MDKRFYIRKLKRGKSSGQRWVVLLHGMLRTPRSMSWIERALKQNGYRVLNFGYPSRSESIRSIAKSLNRAIRKNVPASIYSLDFVTHSLGTIVVRYYLSRYKVRRLGRFVMIAPPNKGSEWARILDRLPLYRWFLGIAGQEIKHFHESLPQILTQPPCEFGVIAGGWGNDSGINPFIPGDDDGTVRVAETQLEGMKDFILIKGQHSTLLMQKRVIDNVISFLGTGKFLF
jgi:pimeloyl-ACP methyl ester carboxylesterase